MKFIRPIIKISPLNVQNSFSNKFINLFSISGSVERGYEKMIPYETVADTNETNSSKN